jgi:hypothetical protein
LQHSSRQLDKGLAGYLPPLSPLLPTCHSHQPASPSWHQQQHSPAAHSSCAREWHTDCKTLLHWLLLLLLLLVLLLVEEVL